MFRVVLTCPAGRIAILRQENTGLNHENNRVWSFHKNCLLINLILLASLKVCSIEQSRRGQLLYDYVPFENAWGTSWALPSVFILGS